MGMGLYILRSKAALLKKEIKTALLISRILIVEVLNELRSGDFRFPEQPVQGLGKTDRYIGQ